MLKVGADAAVGGYDGPFVVEDFYCGVSGVDHGFDGKDHAAAQTGVAAAIGVVVGDLGFFVDGESDAVSAVAGNDAVAVGGDGCGYGFADVFDAVAGDAGGHGGIQGFSGGLKEGEVGGADLTDGVGFGRIAEVAVEFNADVAAHHVAFGERYVAGDSVDYAVVDRGAQGCGESFVAEEGGAAAGGLDCFFHFAVYFLCADAGGDNFADSGEYTGKKVGGAADAVLGDAVFDGNHGAVPVLRSSRALMLKGSAARASAASSAACSLRPRSKSMRACR